MLGNLTCCPVVVCSKRLQLVDRFKMDTHVQRCFESGSSESQYRRAVAVRITAGGPIVVHASRLAASHLRACGQAAASCTPASSTGSAAGKTGSAGAGQVDPQAQPMVMTDRIT
jgi:hypothetical protein